MSFHRDFFIEEREGSLLHERQPGFCDYTIKSNPSAQSESPRTGGPEWAGPLQRLCFGVLTVLFIGKGEEQKLQLLLLTRLVIF